MILNSNQRIAWLASPMLEQASDPLLAMSLIARLRYASPNGSHALQMVRQFIGGIMFEIKTVALFVVTALAEIIGCYLPYLWLKQSGSIWLLVPAAVSLAVFAWLLTLHPAAAGRVYAAYGGVYVAVAFGWLWAVDGIRPSVWDVVGVGVTLAGMAIIAFAPRHA